MKQIILGTAGHIDHGKTSLIKALTGVNTDRLKEEQERGITIELGFADLDLPSGQHVGIVDVPGHEKFVKNMVAGATGIDIVAMVIAADEGVMPQTREHLEICEMLDIQHGLVVLTKTDLVDEEWLELVKEDIKTFVRGTFLDGKPIVPVSSVTGQGLPEFIRILDELSAEVPQRSYTGLFRLPADRVFTMKGFGTVITGTLISGKVRIGDTVMLYPSGVVSKVRGVQTHNESVEEALAGMRTAINFQGLEKTSVNRGDVISSPDGLRASYMIDVSLRFLDSNKKPIKNRTRIRFHAGTSEIMGNLILLEHEELAPGETTVAQIRLDTPLTLVRDDRFVIRSYSPVRTIGGGFVLNPIPQKHKRFKAPVIEGLKGLIRCAPEEMILYHVKESDYAGLSLADLKIMSNLPDKSLQTAIQSLLSSKKLIQADKENTIYIHQEIFEILRNEAVSYLKTYHQANPLKVGMPKEELKSRLPSAVSSKLFNLLMNRMGKDGEMIQEGETIRMASHTVSLKTDQADIHKKILEAYIKGGLTPPYFKDICLSFDLNESKAKEILMVLVKEGKIVKLKEELYFHTRSIEDVKSRLTDFLIKHGEMTTPQFKDMVGVSRKYLIPLLEYFDAKNITIRVGDLRKLRV